MIEALSIKDGIEKALKGGDVKKRTAVLVEDPITGEEKWMLEKVPESEGVEGVLKGRHLITGCDVYVVLVLGASVVSSIVYGRKSVAALVGLEFVKVGTLGLVCVAGWLRFSLTGDLKGDEGLEREY